MLTRLQEFDSLMPAFGSMRRELEKAFTEVTGNGHTASARTFCPISFWQDQKQIHIQMDVPGMTQDQLNLQFDDGKLWIRGERTWADDKVAFEYNERRYGRFERAVALPDSADPSSIDALLSDGVLHITFAKRPEAQPQSIRIRYNAGSKTNLSEKSVGDSSEAPLHDGSAS